MADNLVLYTAVYSDLSDALDDLVALAQVHEDGFIGKIDAAVIDKENGEPHIAKRLDRPRLQVIPEEFGSGPLPRQELKDAARELASDQVCLIVVGEPTLENGFDKTVTKADKVIKHSLDATTDEVASELHEALES